VTAVTDQKMTEKIDPSLPSALREAILADLQPVRPLKPAALRALILVPWAVGALGYYWVVLAPREDLAQLGLAFSWGLSAIQAVLAVILGVGALREGIPGSSWPRSTALASGIGAIGLQAAIGLITFERSRFPEPPGMYLHEIKLCLSHELIIALPILALGFWLLARGLPLRPGIGGALLGLAAGLLAEASWRMICPFTALDHMFPSHTGGIVLLVLIGTAIGALFGRLRPLRR
jgi:hypothetical protein